ncbi:BMP family protein [Borrelia miyamotoi]|uniref:BMP family protein n=1 Tax=Borrelia miyamotoi TaxID=47466 RepID=A0AAP8YRW8_9SPIR|nr:BMP family protein [Borrelia miyamotoi]ATQ14831.1 BMP family protein [Borrelia miyamotoi]ATQ16013.1 BMP family protein [Borrelia miyamotoi]ATQ17159.1 BMP family protein [Borrelia miyamotoi]ATQ18335.1 BMP family protein [Borrelia miyamotoi]ATQ19654.1 BMP family protein [Borrelia miyamotoi]
MLRNVVLFFFILGCVGSQNKVSPSDTISLIVDGTFDDRGFNESSSKAMDKIKEEFEVKMIKKESRVSDYLADMGGLEEAGSRLIWGIGFKFTDTFLQKSIENSDINYAVIEGAYANDVELPKNLVNVKFRSEEGAFLAGYLAAKISKTGKIGFLGGMDVAVVNAFRYGYESGAKYANKNIELNSQYVGTFSDLSFGRSIASKMYASGVDIVFSAAGLSGLGAIEVAKELGDGHYIIGVDQDQSYLAPENIIISYVKRIDAVILDLTRAYLEFGKWNGGKELEFGLRDGVLDLLFNKLINLDLMSDYDGFSEVKNKIINNEIEVPRDKKSYDAFIVSLINKS